MPPSAQGEIRARLAFVIPWVGPDVRGGAELQGWETARALAERGGVGIDHRPGDLRRLADDLAFGTDLSLFVGSGLEYAQSRPYAPGDPIKMMDWRLTARVG